MIVPYFRYERVRRLEQPAGLRRMVRLSSACRAKDISRMPRFAPSWFNLDLTCAIALEQLVYAMLSVMSAGRGRCHL